jgi:hypothetical protein
MQKLLLVILWWYPDHNMLSHYFLEQDYCRERSQPLDFAKGRGVLAPFLPTSVLGFAS